LLLIKYDFDFSESINSPFEQEIKSSNVNIISNFLLIL
jgi:hypothetical protein